MSKISKYKNIVLTLVFIIISLFVIGWSIKEEPEEKEIVKKDNIIKDEKKESKQEENLKIKVDIKGEIVNPGVYELTNKNNVIDVINMAGGLTDKSDTSNINLSKKLEDEMVIIVYSKQEIINMKEKEKIICPPCNNACIKETDEKSKIDITENKNNEINEKNEKININTANNEDLQKLNGIGKAKADAIIDYRTKNGNFKQIEDIKNEQGIGDSAFEKIKDNITV